MRINEFFEIRLRAPLYNHVWSWGAMSEELDIVVLRVGRWAVESYNDGKEWAILLHPDWLEKPAGGLSERIRHIEAMRKGCRGYAVLVDFREDGKISAFDDQTLLQLAPPVDGDDGFVYAQVFTRVSVDKVVDLQKHPEDKAEDVAEIFAIFEKETETERRMMVAARIGQGPYRDAVLRLWDYKCAFTGSRVATAIRASHLIPWKLCTHAERLDPYNGIPLIATLDALFDRGLITFDSNGSLVVSSTVPTFERSRLALDAGTGIGKPKAKTSKFLEFHRQNVLVDDL